jgi:catechol 2,3-dioxygenase-like lactoylglutathione lyase family enzyme
MRIAITRMRRVGSLWLLLTASVAANPLVERVGDITITVSDLEQSITFYRDVLEFQLDARAELSGEPYDHLTGLTSTRMLSARMTLGNEAIELLEFVSPRGRPVPPESRSNDQWFQHVAIIVSDMERAYRQLRQRGVQHVSPGPQRLPDWNAAAGGIEAFYFRDPDSNTLEVLRFPEGKGDPRWQVGGRLFLGIDHTAIVVADTERALTLYRDMLGLQIAGRSENYGPEQERLNSVFAARLRITALRARHGPGIELLEYLAPPGGRMAPADTRPNDLWHWHTALLMVGDDWLSSIQDSSLTWLSTQSVILRHGRRAQLARDSDGHGLLLYRDPGAGE